MIGKVCSNDHHLETSVFDEVFPVHIDKLFDWLFSDSEFYRKHAQSRKTYDINLGEWMKDENDKDRQIRHLSYTLSISYSIGPKCSPSKEKQTMYPESKPGEHYLIEADCHNGGIPYAGTFHTTVRYCMRALPDDKTRFNVTCRVVFTKPVTGFIKMFIEKTAVSGTKSNFHELVQSLRNECWLLVKDESSEVSKKMSKQSEKTSNGPCHNPSTISSTNIYKPQKSLSLPSYENSQEECQTDYADHLLKILIITLLVVSLINAFMYVQIITLEASLDKYMSSRSYPK